MTVKELIEELQKYPPDMEVVTKGAYSPRDELEPQPKIKKFWDSDLAEETYDYLRI